MTITKWLYISFVCAFLLAATAPGDVAPVSLGNYQMPAAESEEVVTRSLRESGFTVSSRSGEEGNTIIAGERGGESIRVEIRRHSPLASTVEVAGSVQTVDLLKSALQGHIANPAQQGSPPPLPPKVRSLPDCVVCLKASIKGETVQFTGFVIDRRGYILSTAHDVGAVHRIMTDARNGQELKGEVVKQDLKRDLSLIKVSQSFPSSVPVQKGRRRLRRGDRVYSIGCPQWHKGQMQTGIVDRPPALVKGEPLWQLNMEVLPGSSGSPVVDEEGRLVGVVKGRFRGTQTRGFVIPLDTVREFLLRGRR